MTGVLILRYLAAILLATAVTLPTPAPAWAAPDVPAVVGQAVDRLLADGTIPGAAVAVVRDGRLVLVQGYGAADRATGRPVTAATGFFLASVTKLLTAEAVLDLVAQGRLDLHADVNTYLTGLRVADRWPGRPVTLHHLLTHTSGFADTILGVSTPGPVPAAALGPWLAAHQPPRLRPPGVLAAYDNYGYALAGYVVESVTGTPFPDWIERHVLTAAGMTASAVGKPSPAALAIGYRADGEVAGAQYGPLTPTGAGAVSTATDMGRFLLHQLRPGNPLLAQRFTQDPRLPGVGYGWEHHLDRTVGKAGDLPGFHGYAALDPAAGTGVHVVFTGDGADGAAERGARELARQVLAVLSPPAGAAPGIGTGGEPGVSGRYRSTRRNPGDVTAMAALTTAVTVDADGGDLRTTGLGVGERRWRPAAGVDGWTDGAELLVVRDGVLLTSADPTVAYERVPWWADPRGHTAVAGVALSVLLVALLWWPAAAVVRRRRASAWAARLATGTGVLGAATVVGSMVLVGSVLGDGATVTEHILLDDSVPLSVARALLAGATAPAVGMLVGTVMAWRRGWWTRSGRAGYTTAASALPAFLAVAATYGLVGW